MATRQPKNYDESNIRNLQFPESIRSKATMYIGPVDASGVLTILREAADNVIDEALEGRASSCDIHLGDNEYWVIDDGNGIPVGPMVVKDSVTGSSSKIPAIRAILAMMHTSGKFDDSAYAAARGVHGVGVKATNALSTEFEVHTCRDGQWYSISFKKGKLTGDLSKVSAPLHPFTQSKLRKGTMIRFKPDTGIFSSVRLPKPDLFNWARMSAYFTPGLSLTLSHAASEKPRVLHYPNGPLQYVEDRVQELAKTSEFGMLSDLTFSTQNPLLDCVLKFSSYDGCDALAFTNGLRNIEGGVHLTALFNALRDAINPYAGKKQQFTTLELRDGLIGLINVKLSTPQFDSQTKDKLVDARGGEQVKDLLLAELSAFFKKNKKLAEQICDRASRLKELKTKFVASKQMLTALKKIVKKGLPAKAATAPKCKPEERECYLLEGDSAAGGLRFARNEYFQEFLPLKGKPRNLMKDKKSAGLASEEILNIFAMIGFDPKNESPYEKLRVSKIIIMADSDSDGWHIATLILGIFYKYLPALFDLGRVYITRVPEYYAIHNRVLYTGDSLDEVQSLLVKEKIKADVNHLKGYGECPSDLLRIFACDPATRRLYKVQPATSNQFELLMSNDSSSRKILLGI
jgi:DNA gyrase subunit B